MLRELIKTFSQMNYLGHISKHSVFSFIQIDSVAFDEKYKPLV